jgi:DNA replication protein DnaC
VNTLFLTVPDLLDWLRFAYDSQESSFEQRFDEIRNKDLLILDDLGTQNATPWAEEKLFQIIDYRYLRRLPTVVTTNLDLRDLDERVRSRLQDPEVVTLVRVTAPDYRTPMQESRDPLLAGLTLLNDRSFGNWSMREPEHLSADETKSLEKAYHAAQQFAEDPSGWLVLMGSYGCGKTHLAAAVGNYRRALGEDPIFVVVPDLLDHLRATYSPSSAVGFDSLFERVKTASLLILDDLGTQSATPWAREKLYQLFNYRYMARLPMVITTSCKLEEIDERLRSRMVDARLCSMYAIFAPSYRSTAGAGGKARRTRTTRT